MVKELETLLLANPKSNAWKFTQDVYNVIKKIEEKRGDYGFGLGEIEVSNWPDGEFEPRIIPNCRGRKVVFVQDSSIDPSRWLVESLMINDAIRRGGAEQIIDVFPYMRWSRGEKKDKPHMPIPTKVVADVLSNVHCASRADRIISYDIHAESIPGFFSIPFDALHSFNIVASYLSEKHPELLDNLVVVAPDTGGVKRARAFADRLGKGYHVAIIDKTRKDGETVETHDVIGNVNGKNCLMVDDVLSSGGTLRNGATELKKHGARRVMYYATHFVGVGNFCENLRDFDVGFTTDSFYHKPENLCGAKVITMAPLFGEAIYRAISGESVSELFQRRT